MYLSPKTVKENRYYYVLNSLGGDNRDRKKVALYLGRLDHLTPEKCTEIERDVLALGDDKVLHDFYAQLAEYGHPVPRPTHPGVLEDGPFPLGSVDFATLTEALHQDDLTSRDLAALVSRIGLPLRPDELLAVGIRVEVGKKTDRSISLYYRRTSSPRPGSARTATRGSRRRRRATGSSPASSPL